MYCEKFCEKDYDEFVLWPPRGFYKANEIISCLGTFSQDSNINDLKDPINDFKYKNDIYEIKVA